MYGADALGVFEEGPGVAAEDEPDICEPESRAAREDVRANEVRGFRLAMGRGFGEADGGKIGFE